jgi:hypothetical protein
VIQFLIDEDVAQPPPDMVNTMLVVDEDGGVTQFELP